MKITDTVVDIVEATFRAHPKECIFKRGWRDEVFSRLRALNGPTSEEFIDACTEAFKSAELYCPHEGINRMPHP